jgi:mannose-1-phosphate guanylyltransferase
MIYAVILAGGSGTRLWPRSRESMPKQFLDITGERTMLQEAVARIEALIPLERVFVVTNREYLPIVRRQLPALPEPNAIGEIVGRGTAPAIGLAAITLQKLDPDATMVVLTADHLISRREEFRRVLLSAARVAESGQLVTLGIHPTHAETGYGYIERGERLGQYEGFDAYRVLRFTEKPDRDMAREFVAAGRFSWNSGMFIWRVDAILREMLRLMPATRAQLEEIGVDLGTERQEETLQRIWPYIEKETIDFGVMERAADVVVVPAEIGWNDVGCWSTLLDLLPGDVDGNIVSGDVCAVDTQRSLIYSSGRLVATIGLEDMIVVEAGDAILVCPRSRAQDVRQIVDRLKESGRERFLK